jgi:hypothetical protein
MSDSVFLLGDPHEDAWEKDFLPPDDLEFPPELEAQLAAVLAMDDSMGGTGGDFDLSQSAPKTHQTENPVSSYLKGMGRLFSSSTV